MDRRAAKTKKAIREAFLSLLEEKSINQITVVEISQAADLGRGTFYLHYKDIYDLYDSIENELYLTLENLIDNAYPYTNPANLLNLTNTLTEYIDKHREYFLLLIRPENNGKSLQKIKVLLCKKTLWEVPGADITEDDVVECMFCISGVIGVLEEWLYNGLELPQKQIAAMLYKILFRFSINCGGI